ncbi:MAG: DUF4234 domain-containing protein [Firmicutes bacterium]|nr:DUF4234 domain-containing protein [Bacillota bacterium]
MSNPNFNMKRRNLVVMFLLMFFFPFPYLIWWSCSVQNQFRQKTGMGFGGVGHFFMMIITFGIYQIYWHFAVGKRITAAGGPKRSSRYGWLYLLGLALTWGLMIGGMAMIISPFMDVIDTLMNADPIPEAEEIVEMFMDVFRDAMGGVVMIFIGSTISSVFMYLVPMLIQNDVNRVPQV